MIQGRIGWGVNIQGMTKGRSRGVERCLDSRVVT